MKPLDRVDLNDGEITFCDHSNFTDLCKGGHIPNTGIIKAVKITNVAGAYWRANKKNKQLTRVYGISFPKQKLLSEYLLNVEENLSYTYFPNLYHHKVFDDLRNTRHP